MSTTMNSFVDNMDIKCRCCFKIYKNIKESIKITRTIENQIQEITNMEVNIIVYFYNNFGLISDLSSSSRFHHYIQTVYVNHVV